MISDCWLRLLDWITDFDLERAENISFEEVSIRPVLIVMSFPDFLPQLFEEVKSKPRLD